MKIFLASTNCLCYENDFLKNMALSNKLYILESFYYISPFITSLIPYFSDFLLDSGAFTFMNNKKDLNYNEYLERLISYINENNIKKFFELDIDSLIGYEKVLELRKILEKETNKKCIPVFHKSRGLKEWERMCEEYDYVAIGTIGEYFKNFSILHKLLNIAKKNKTKVHGLGFTQLSKLHSFDFYSVDSTSWKCGNRYGFIFKFTGKGLIQIGKQKGQRLIAKKALLHNFSEWVKYQKYVRINTGE